jgi:LysM repeat protein
MLFHTVRPGDTMSGLAARFGISLDDLLAANSQVTDPDVIVVGQVLGIPDTGDEMPAGATMPGVYVVQAGDTMSAIAARFGITLDALAVANPQVTNINFISVGQMLAIPGGNPHFGNGAHAGGNGAATGIPERLARWLPLVRPAAAHFSVRASIILGVIEVETNGHNVIGDGGHGHGLMQIDDRSFGDWLARNANGLDPASNIMFGAGLLRQNIDFFNGNLRAGIAAFNAGPGGVQRALAETGDPDARTTGGNYSRRVLAHAAAFASADV